MSRSAHQTPDSREDLDRYLLPPVAAWFRRVFGEPTPPQAKGWPEIAAGRHTLICAPTGSGKTLAAFLACLDHLWRRPRTQSGVRILYISPLKALNEDIARNLDFPLAGVLATARELDYPLEPLRVAVRTGDTPPAERQKLVRKPPDILITTPESLHLMLTSRARETFRSVSHVLVDEIHALAPNKRGVFLALLLERLEALNPASFVRVGLSATQRPLEEVARYLGGLRRMVDSEGRVRFEARPVSIVDAGRRKEMDLEVAFPGPSAGIPLQGSIWPAIEERLMSLIASHRSTIVFANNRRIAERLTARLNERFESDVSNQIDGGEFLASTPPEPQSDAASRLAVESHHGSLSPARRRETEERLKAGELPAVVATASLELGIDMGAVDLVCQVESPGSVSRGLQRVGRAGHLVGRTSKGRLLAKTPADLLESAALAHAMLHGEVEALRVPANCLDILAQQVVACVAVDRWDVADLFDLVRSAYPYRDLTPAAFESVLKLVSGRFGVETFRDLQPRVSWDRVHNRLLPLPGTAQRALSGGGAIPDTGQYPLHLGADGPKLGELDEEFVLERRVGETFVLGTATWKIEAIDALRVVVAPAAGRPAFVPFWRGEGAHRTAQLGASVGALTREIGERLDDPELVPWLQETCRLDAHSAGALRRFVGRQIAQAGAAPDDRTVLVETFRDPAGETALAVLTPFGGRLHHALKLVLQGALRQRLGVEVATLHGDDGLLIRLPGMDEPPLDVFRGLSAGEAERLLRQELGDSALFGLRFRQNAGRALLLPKPDPSKRTPLWLQRLRAKDLLQIVRRFPDFPILVETFRECLDEDLDLPALRAFLDSIENGSTRVVTRRAEVSSPFVSGLVFQFQLQYLYEWDTPLRGDAPRSGPGVDVSLLDPLLDPATAARWLDPNAVGRVEGRLRGTNHPPRSADEMAEWLRRLGDLAPSELDGPMASFVESLRDDGRATLVELRDVEAPLRWILTEELPLYASAFGPALNQADEDSSPDVSTNGESINSQTHDNALSTIVRRFLQGHALIGLDELLARYPIDPATATDLLERWAESDDSLVVRIEGDAEHPSSRWADRRNLDEVRRLSIALQRRESIAVTPEVFADFVVRRQGVHPETRREGEAAVASVLEQLQGFAAPAEFWEGEILPRRVGGYRPTWLDEPLGSGLWTWRAAGTSRGGDPLVAIVPRGFDGSWPAVEDDDNPIDPDESETRVLDALTRRGAVFVDELALHSGLEPSRVRRALAALLRRGLVTNDRFEPLRPGGELRLEALTSVSAEPTGRGRPRLGSARRRASLRPEGRWSLVPSREIDPETSALAWSAVLLDRYGVLTRETAALDPWAPPWRELYPVLNAAELRGEVRRGYFVEGLSGVQYANADTADTLTRLAGAPSDAPAPLVLLSSLDPANFYGSGAPFDIPLLDGGTARLVRSPGHFLVLKTGRPVLIIEAFGRRLTGLASASESDLRSSLSLLPTLAGPSRRILKVESYNALPALSSPASAWLAEIGFVRDHPGMAFYAGW